MITQAMLEAEVAVYIEDGLAAGRPLVQQGKSKGTRTVPVGNVAVETKVVSSGSL